MQRILQRHGSGWEAVALEDVLVEERKRTDDRQGRQIQRGPRRNQCCRFVEQRPVPRPFTQASAEGEYAHRFVVRSSHSPAGPPKLLGFRAWAGVSPKPLCGPKTAIASAWNMGGGVIALGDLVDTTSIAVRRAGEYIAVDS